MMRLRLLLIAAGVVILGIVFAQPVKATITTQESQIAVTVVVNVTPSPLAYNPAAAPAAGGQSAITSKFSLRRITPALAPALDAQSLQFGPGSVVVAQAQSPLLVQAEVTPNPKATILYSNNNSVVINAIAGSTVQIPCAFTVTIDMTTAWSLEQGLSNDFSSDFNGNNLANDTYVNSATPKPTSTPYVVYADDGSEWSLAGSGSTLTTYCVTLTLTVPGDVTAGTYSSNVIYTLYN
jgi:hypothetical protein